MQVYRHYRLAAGARIVASICFALGAAGPISCHAARLNVGADGNLLSPSREILPLDKNAARYANLYDAIEHLRPEYLRVREQGPTTLMPVAYLNGSRLIDPTMLRHVPVSETIDVRWVRPNLTSPLYEASSKFGGAIFVRTK